MAFLNGIDSVRAVEWGRTYLWDIQFQDPTIPSPFNTWFPAKEVEEELAKLNSHTFTSGISTYKIPQNTETLNVKITFYDNSDYDLLNWLENWINTISLNGGFYVATLSTAAKFLQIIKMDNERNTIDTSSYWVYPEGTLTYMGNSESGAITYSMNFVIVG